MKFIGTLFVFCLAAGAVKAQETVVATTASQQLPKVSSIKLGKNDTIKTYVTNDNGHLEPWLIMPQVNITDVRIFKSDADRQAYNQLVYNVHKVMPYAHFAGERYKQLQRDLALTADKRKQKELVNACNQQIKDLFKREVENLTISQGEILIKLIDRETGNTSYQLVTDLKGGLDAFMLQSVARLFGHNLKETYDPEQDRDIEQILQQAGFDSATY
jgi:hypothetical protein